MLAISRNFVKLAHHLRSVFQIGNRFEKRHNIDAQICRKPAAEQEQTVNFDDVQSASALADDVSFAAFRAVFALDFFDGGDVLQSSFRQFIVKNFGVGGLFDVEK